MIFSDDLRAVVEHYQATAGKHGQTLPWKPWGAATGTEEGERITGDAQRAIDAVGLTRLLGTISDAYEKGARPKSMTYWVRKDGSFEGSIWGRLTVECERAVQVQAAQDLETARKEAEWDEIAAERRELGRPEGYYADALRALYRRLEADEPGLWDDLLLERDLIAAASRARWNTTHPYAQVALERLGAPVGALGAERRLPGHPGRDRCSGANWGRPGARRLDMTKRDQEFCIAYGIEIVEP